MGFDRKVCEVWWLLLLLAGLMLAGAATPTTGKEEDGATIAEGSYGGSQRMCEIKCQHWVDLTRRQQCIDFCIKYQLVKYQLATADIKKYDGATIDKGGYGGSQRMCEIKCQHWVDLTRRQQCIDFCIKYQLVKYQLATADIKKYDGATIDKGGYRGSQRMCEIKCQHWVDLARRQQCIDFCIKYQLEKYQLATADMKKYVGATIDKGGYGGSQRMCEIKCQHWVDLARRQQCIDFCIKYQLAKYQLAMAGIKKHGGATLDKGTYSGSQRMCEIKCQHWVDLARRQQCIDFCIKYQLAAVDVKQDDGDIAGEDNFGGSQCMCEIKCQHWVDSARRQQCIDFCIKYQMAAPGGGEEDDGTKHRDDDINGGEKHDGATATTPETIRQVV